MSTSTNALDKHTKSAIQEDIELTWSSLQMEYYSSSDRNIYKNFEEYWKNKIDKGIVTHNEGFLSSDIDGEIVYTDKNGREFYIEIDEAGNVRVGKEATTPDFETFSYMTEWDNTMATIKVLTPTSGLQYKIGTSENWTNYSESSKPTVESGTTIYFQVTDGTNAKEYDAITPLWKGMVTYDANGGTEGVPAVQNVEHTKTVNVSFSPVPTRTNYTFLGWATSSDATTATYSQTGTKTFIMPASNVILYAVWEELITAESIAKNPVMYYGKTVNYTPPNEATSNWKIFYADASNIYLISSDYVKISSMPAGKGGTSLTETNTYTAKLTSVISDYSGMDDINANNPARKWLNMPSGANTQANTKSWKMTAYLMDTDIFECFSDSNVADYAVGGVPMELFVASYNMLNQDLKLVAIVNQYGMYSLEYEDGSTGGNSSGGHCGLNNNQNELFYKSSTSRAKICALAAPTSYGGSYTYIKRNWV